MDFYQSLAAFKNDVDKELAKHFTLAISEARQKDKIAAKALTYAKELTLAGGKRLRPALLFWGYLAAGGKERKKILQVAAGIELVHMFLLVHDDIIDLGETRHGKETFNVKYASVGRELFKLKEGKRFGESMAIVAGDILYALGNELILRSGFAPELILQVMTKLQKVVNITAIGQMQDVYIEHKEDVRENEVLKMYANKTAQYSFEGPLLMGAILAGNKDEKFIAKLSDYALPLGVAFQLQDDILGIFGSEEKLGKSCASDIMEGKRTVLVVKALSVATAKQKQQMKKALGNKMITERETEDFKAVLIETGALEYARSLMQKLITKSKWCLNDFSINKEAKEFFFGMADFMEKRQC